MCINVLDYIVYNLDIIQMTKTEINFQFSLYGIKKTRRIPFYNKRGSCLDGT